MNMKLPIPALPRALFEQKDSLLRFFWGETPRAAALLQCCEFTLDLELGGVTRRLTDADCTRLKEGARAVYDHSLFSAEVVYEATDAAVRKHLRVTAKQALLLRRGCLLHAAAFEPLSRGGEGQPVFVGGSLFAGTEFPAAENAVQDDRILLEQSPYLPLAAGERYSFYPAVIGPAGAGGPLEAFRAYIEARRLTRGRKAPKIYCDWALHDELGDNIELNEKLAMDALDRLLEMERAGIRFDYYLMDDFWFETGEPYTSFKRRTWPRGAGPFLSRLREHGIKFGLWFDVNLAGVKLRDRDDIRREGRTDELCMACPEAARLLSDAVAEHIRTHDVRMLKFDFAYFECGGGSHPHGRGLASKEPAVRNFLKLLERARAAADGDLVVLGYNGFTTALDWIGSVTKDRRGFAVSPFWALYLDYAYCGDPRPGELPMPSGRLSTIQYTDAMVRQFYDSAFPLASVDDHGTIVAETSTIYGLGKSGWRDSWIMNLSRGGKKLHLYGNHFLLDDGDLAFMEESLSLYERLSGDAYRTAPVGDPLDRRPYGYSNSRGGDGYLTLVNPTASPAPAAVSLPEWAGLGPLVLRKFYENGAFVNGGALLAAASVSLPLRPFEVTVYRWEQAAADASCGQQLLAAGETAVLRIAPGRARWLLIRFTGDGFAPVRTPTGMPEDIRMSFSGAALSPHWDRRIWSGRSWCCYRIGDSSGALTLEAENCSKTDLRLLWETAEDFPAEEDTDASLPSPHEAAARRPAQEEKHGQADAVSF